MEFPYINMYKLQNALKSKTSMLNKYYCWNKNTWEEVKE